MLEHTWPFSAGVLPVNMSVSWTLTNHFSSSSSSDKLLVQMLYWFCVWAILMLTTGTRWASPGTQQERILLQCSRCKSCGFNPWAWTIPWRRKWQLTPVFLPGKFSGQRSLTGYKESDMTEHSTDKWNMIWEIWNQYEYSKLPQDLTGRSPDWKRPLSTNLLGQFLPIWLQCEGENVPTFSSFKVLIGYFYHLWTSSHTIFSLWVLSGQSSSFKNM